VVYDDLGRFDQAVANFSEAIRADPTNAAAYWNRGAVLCDRQECEQAIADFTRALDLDPDYAQAYYDRGMVYRALDHREKAAADFESYLDLAAEDEDAQIAAAREYLEEMRPEGQPRGRHSAE